jgi:hypothetical protein
MPKKRPSRSAVSAVIARSPCRTSVMRLRCTLIALASVGADPQRLEELHLEDLTGVDRSYPLGIVIQDLSIVDGGIAGDAHGGYPSLEELRP